MEEALRRYQIQYHMVGGFSFYERAEVKDILSYMKLVLNPHDSIALARVVNSPARGIGKTTMETLERIALTTGISTWDAIVRATEDQLLPARALQALAKFRRLIEDARAMLGSNFADKLTADLAPEGDATTEYEGEYASEDATEFDPEEVEAESSEDNSVATRTGHFLRHQFQLRLRLWPQRRDFHYRTGERREFRCRACHRIRIQPLCAGRAQARSEHHARARRRNYNGQ